MDMIFNILLGMIGTAPLSWGFAAGIKLAGGRISWATVGLAPVWMYPIYIIALTVFQLYYM
jgi:hypothetical protein